MSNQVRGPAGLPNEYQVYCPHERPHEWKALMKKATGLDECWTSGDRGTWYIIKSSRRCQK